MAESTPLENVNTGARDKHVRYFKMKVLKNHKSSEINETIENNIEDTSIVFSDKSTSYVDIAISNAKRTLLGIYHKIKGKYLQNYLNEFCYKLNRRYFGEKLFNRLLIAVTQDVRYSNG